MNRATTRAVQEGARFAASAWWRLFARLLVLAVVASFILPPPTAFAAGASTCASSEVHLASSVAHVPDHPADAGIAQHCAHCACHQAFRAEIDAASVQRPSVLVRFATADADGPKLAQAPPHQPPRA